MLRRTILLLCCLVIARTSAAQTGNLYVSPGIRFGYQLGEGGGFYGGVEVSTSYWFEFGTVGGAVFLDFQKGFTPTRGGFVLQGSDPRIGIATGPIFYLHSKETAQKPTDWQIMLFAGAVVMPYYAYLFSGSHEVGAFVKFPVLMKGKEVAWFKT